MYNVNKNINSEGNTISFLDVGIHEDVELKSVEYKVSPKGNEFMVFTFEKEGKTVTLTEWVPKDNDPKKLEEKKENQIIRVKHIVTKFVPEEVYEFSATTFKEFCDKTLAILGNKYVGKKVRVKVIYNYSNYTTLPPYTPFIESMDIPKENSKLSILSIDKMKKDWADSEVTTQNNPFENTQDQEDPQSDIPQTPNAGDLGQPDDLPF